MSSWSWWGSWGGPGADAAASDARIVYKHPGREPWERSSGRFSQHLQLVWVRPILGITVHMFGPTWPDGQGDPQALKSRCLHLFVK